MVTLAVACVASSLGAGGGLWKGRKENLQGWLRILNIYAQKVNAKYWIGGEINN